MEILTVQEAARRLRLTEQAVYLAVREGRLKTVKILGRIGVPKESLDNFRRQRNGRSKVARAAA